MRPALLRLLKRPSALSVLDSLISIPLGVEELESKYRSECLRYHSRAASQRIESHGADNERPDRRDGTRPSPWPSSFRVYDIRSPRNEETNGNDRTKQPAVTISATKPTRDVGLRLDKLEYESDVGHTDGIGTRLVDDPARRHDFALWEELLRYRQRHYGDKGTRDIWEGLMVRVDGVQLPVKGEQADFFWQSFVDLALKRTILLNELASYASRLWKETGNRWDKFYEAVVGGLIARGMPQQAVEWHKKLQNPHLSEPNDILRILESAIAPRPKPSYRAPLPKNRHASAGLWVFQNICRSTKGHRIYGPVISTMLRNGLYEDLFQMHEVLIAQNDHPESYEDAQPLLEYAKENWSFSRRKKLNAYVESCFPERGATAEEDIATKEPHIEGGKSRGDKPFKDELGARLFATKALNFDMILSGLRMFGVPAIGPQTLREMAIRAHGGQDILKKLRQLQDAGISVGDSVFTRLVRKLANEHREVLLSDFISSDQHFEMLEDVAAQESLLVSYYAARDWRQYNMTLAILAEISPEGPDLSNIHFRKFIAADEWRFASKLVDDMALHGGSLSNESIDFMVDHILPARQPGHLPQKIRGRSLSEDLAFVVQILQRAAKSGTAVPAKLWIEILKRLGMINRWHDLRDCCLWLARQYSPAAKHAVGSPINRSPSAPCDRLPTIFTGQMQAAIVSWGFKMRIARQPDKPYATFRPDQAGLIPWVRGLVLLRELEQHGVHLHVREIRQTCRQRLKVIFGPPIQSSRRMNRMLRRENPYSLERVIGDINRVWGEPSLFGGREYVDLFRLVNPPISKMSLRKMSRNRRRTARELDV